MKKNISNVIVVLLAIGILTFLFWLLFLRDNPQANKPPANQNNTKTTTTNKPSTPVDANSDQLTAAQNKEVQTFLYQFLQKYVSYDESKPTAHIENVKNMMTPDLYQKQRQNSQKLGIKNIKIKKINIDSINVEERFTTVTVSLNVTVKYSNNYQKDTLFLYTLSLHHNKSGWKVGSISDESPEY